MRFHALFLLLLAVLCDVNPSHAMRIKRGTAVGAHAHLKTNENISTHNAGKQTELNETHKSIEKVSKLHEAQNNKKNKEEVCSITTSDEHKTNNFKKSTHENNLKDVKINIIKSNDNSAAKQNGLDNEDGDIKIYLVDTCASPLIQTQGQDFNSDNKLKKHETDNNKNNNNNNNNTEKKFKNSNQRYTEEANKPFYKQESQHKSHYDNSPKLTMNNKFTNNAENVRPQNYLNNKYNDKEFTKSILDEQKSPGDSLKRMSAVALNRPLLKIVAKYKPHGNLQSANSGLNNLTPLEGIISFANMLLYSMNKDNLQNNLADKESCIGQPQDFDDSSAMDYLYNIIDQNAAVHGMGADGISQLSPLSQKYFTNNEQPSSMNFFENAIESIFSNDYDGENDLETPHCPIHAEYNNNINKKNIDGTDDGVVQVCSCRLYKKNRDLHHF